MQRSRITFRHTARHALSGMLSAAVLLSGLVFAPLPARATGAGPEQHYSFQATTGSYATNHTALPSNVIVGENSYRPAALAVYSGQMYLPEGPATAKSFRMVNNVGTRSADGTTYTKTSELADPTYHYGLPYRTYTNDSQTVYYKAASESLEFELAQMPDLDTTGIAAANVSFVFIKNPGEAGLNIPFDRRLQVYVSLDGETWLPDSVGVRSSTLIAGGTINATMEGLFFQIETENLLDIEGVTEGAIIKGIKIQPEGADASTGGSFYINKLSVNTYDSLNDFNTYCPADMVTTTSVDGDDLRAIVVNEAVRTAQTEWTAAANITSTTPSGSSSVAESTNVRTYYAGHTYRGPIYERDTDSTRELFQSPILDGVYGTGDQAYGMDCQTFVYNAISRISRTGAHSVKGTPAASRVSLLGGLSTVTHPVYTDKDIVDQNDEQAIYENYAASGAGDVAIHFLTNDVNTVHTRIVKQVHVERNSDGSIDPANSWVRFTEQAGGVIFACRNTETNAIEYKWLTSPNSVPTGYELLYGSSSRAGDEVALSFAQLYGDNYVVYTLDEYAIGEVENVAVQAVAGSKTANTHFADGGLNLAISSNYRIISYQVELESLSSGEPMYDSGLVYSMGSLVVGLNHSSDELDALLRQLPNGSYRINLSVDAGPFTNLSQTTVPRTIKSFEFTVSGRSFCAGEHGTSDGWIALNPGDNITAGGNYYLADDGDFTALSGKISINPGADQSVTLCLNGKTVQYFSGSDDKLFYAQSGNITLCDCSGENVITAGAPDSTKYALSVTAGAQVTLVDVNIKNGYSNYGAVYLSSGSDTASAELTMMGGEISGNTATKDGAAGAVMVGAYAKLNLWDGAKISGNTSTSTVRGAGGVYVAGSGTTTGSGGIVNMYGGEISGNTSAVKGGGVLMFRHGTFNMYGGKIDGNSSPNGGGVYLWRLSTANFPTFTLYGGTISNNAATNTSSGYGGGVYAEADTVFHMSGGSVSGNTSKNAGGIYTLSAKTVMSGGIIGGNIATAGRGGGIQVGSAATFTMTGGQIRENIASAGGGGVNVIAGGTFMMHGGTITQNSSATKAADGTVTLGSGSGAGINNYGSMVMFGGTVSGNNTSGNGKDINVASTSSATVEGTLTINGGIVGTKGTSSCLYIYASAEQTPSATINGGTVNGLNAVRANNQDYTVTYATVYFNGGTFDRAFHAQSGNGVNYVIQEGKVFQTIGDGMYILSDAT